MSVRLHAVIAAALIPAPLFAGSPALRDIAPNGGQRGQTVEVVFSGQRLADAKGVLFHTTGIEAKSVTVADDKKVQVSLAIAGDCAPGEHALRLWTASGITEVRTFSVGTLPVVAEQAEAATAEKPQRIPLHATVAGVIKPEQSDWFAIEGKKGQRVIVQVEGMRLGRAMFDPSLVLSTRDGREIARCDDSALFVQDPLLSAELPEDGEYRIELRDRAFAGGERAAYRLHVTTGPQPVAVFPPGGPEGQPLEVDFIGEDGKTIRQTLPPLSPATEALPVFAQENGETALSPNPIRVSPFPNVLEAEPNNYLPEATPAAAPLPLAFNGILSTAGDVDHFRFAAKKDGTFDINVFGRRLRSPIDSVLQVFDPAGKQMISNDDAGGPDSYARFKAPADGHYTVAVKDQLARGGVAFTYRVEIAPETPSVELALPVVTQQPSQERQAVPVPRGNRYATMVRVKRSEFSGEVTLKAAALPDGLALQSIQAGGDAVPVVFEADADAPVTAKMCDLTAVPAETGQRVKSTFSQGIDLVIGNPNNNVFYRTEVGKLPVAITEEAPCKLRIIEPKVPLVQNGAMGLKVVAERREGFTGPIHVAMLYNPAGIGSQASITIPAGENEATIPLSASGDAKPRVWKIAVTGHADAGQGAVWISSQLANLEVAPPFVTGQIERTKVAPGETVKIVCKLKQNRPFVGTSTVQLLNLPTKTTAREVQVSATDQEIAFEVATDPSTPIGTKKDLFCQMTIAKDGESITQNIAHGGIVRVVATAEARRRGEPGEKVVSAR